jgi:hypothetical protein
MTMEPKLAALLCMLGFLVLGTSITALVLWGAHSLIAKPQRARLAVGALAGLVLAPMFWTRWSPWNVRDVASVIVGTFADLTLPACLLLGAVLALTVDSIRKP